MTDTKSPTATRSASGGRARRQRRLGKLPRGVVMVLPLIVIHALGDVALEVFRFQSLAPDMVELLAAALPRAQICLLALWLAAGRERFTWRVCATLGGAAFVFSIFARTVFPGRYEAAESSVWLAEEWTYFFRSTGPGDLVVKAPVMILGIAMLVGLYRIAGLVGKLARWSGWVSKLKTLEWLRFRFGDVGIWVGTVSLVMVAVFRTARYPEWNGELIERWVNVYGLENSHDLYAVATAGLYVLLAIACLWLVCGRLTWWLRLLTATTLVAATTFACGYLPGATVPDNPPSNEWLPVSLTAAIVIATLVIYRLYDRLLTGADASQASSNQPS